MPHVLGLRRRLCFAFVVSSSIVMSIDDIESFEGPPLFSRPDGILLTFGRPACLGFTGVQITRHSISLEIRQSVGSETGMTPSAYISRHVEVR